MNNDISIYVTEALSQYSDQIATALIATGFTDGYDNSELVQDWNALHPFNCAMRLFVLANEADMVAIQNAIIEAIFTATGIRLAVNFTHGCVTWFDVVSIEATSDTKSFEIMSSEIGFEFDTDVLIKCDREPVTQEDWNTINEFMESAFPLTANDLSHGFVSDSCMVYLPEAD